MVWTIPQSIICLKKHHIKNWNPFSVNATEKDYSNPNKNLPINFIKSAKGDMTNIVFKLPYYYVESLIWRAFGIFTLKSIRSKTNLEYD